MLHRVGVASAFAVSASLVSGIAAIAMTTGPTVITAKPARAATAVPVGTVDARVRTDDGAPLAGSPASTNATPTASSSDAKIVTAFWAAVAASSEVAQPVPANSGPVPSTPHQPSSGTRPPTSPSTNRPPATPPTTAPNPSPPPYNCAGSDDGMTEAYKHAREQYCQGGGD